MAMQQVARGAAGSHCAAGARPASGVPVKPVRPRSGRGRNTCARPVAWSWGGKKEATPSPSSSNSASATTAAPTTNFSVLNQRSFSEQHPELASDPLWFEGGRNQGAPATAKATRSDVRLVTEFNSYLKSNKLDLLVRRGGMGVRSGLVPAAGQGRTPSRGRATRTVRKKSAHLAL